MSAGTRLHPTGTVTHPAADFSFGVPIQAIKEWSAGRQSIPVEANDEKAKWLVFVSQERQMRLGD